MADEDQHCPSAAVIQMTSGPDVADNLRRTMVAWREIVAEVNGTVPGT